MSRAFVDFLSTRPTRERWLIGVLILIVVPLAVVFGVLLPMSDAQKDAHRAQSEARALQDWVIQRVVEKNSLASQNPRTAPSAPIGSSGIEQSLIDAGLRGAVSQLGVRDGGVIALRFDEVTFTTLGNWLSASEPQWGYTLSSFRIEAIEAPVKISGKVSASLTLTPAN